MMKKYFILEAEANCDCDDSYNYNYSCCCDEGINLYTNFKEISVRNY